jgi:hypothetical protein
MRKHTSHAVEVALVVAGLAAAAILIYGIGDQIFTSL